MLQIQYSIAIERHLKNLLELTVFVLLSADVVRYNTVHYMLTETLHYHVLRTGSGYAAATLDIDPIYTRDGSSIWDELGQRTIVR